MTKNGDTVRVHYTGRLTDGEVFSTSIGNNPLQFTVGSDMVIPGFDRAVVGMEPGESKVVVIPANDAYGPYYSELVQEMSRKEIPANLELKIGQRLRAQKENGQIATITVLKLSESKVTIDANHPLAGKDLTIDIELIDII